jgi:hypothetical protein
MLFRRSTGRTPKMEGRPPSGATPCCVFISAGVFVILQIFSGSAAAQEPHARMTNINGGTTARQAAQLEEVRIGLAAGRLLSRICHDLVRPQQEQPLSARLDECVREVDERDAAQVRDECAPCPLGFWRLPGATCACAWNVAPAQPETKR